MQTEDDNAFSEATVMKDMRKNSNNIQRLSSTPQEPGATGKEGVPQYLSVIRGFRIWSLMLEDTGLIEKMLHLDVFLLHTKPVGGLHMLLLLEKVLCHVRNTKHYG